MMGRGLDRLQQVPAGNVIAIGGLGTAILKSATITSSPACRPLAPMLFQVTCFDLLIHVSMHSCFIHLFLHSFIRSLIRSFDHWLVCLLVCFMFVCWFVRSFSHSFVHSFIQSTHFFPKVQVRTALTVCLSVYIQVAITFCSCGIGARCCSLDCSRSYRWCQHVLGLCSSIYRHDICTLHTELACWTEHTTLYLPICLQALPWHLPGSCACTTVLSHYQAPLVIKPAQGNAFTCREPAPPE